MRYLLPLVALAILLPIDERRDSVASACPCISLGGTIVNAIVGDDYGPSNVRELDEGRHALLLVGRQTAKALAAAISAPTHPLDM